MKYEYAGPLNPCREVCDGTGRYEPNPADQASNFLATAFVRFDVKLGKFKQRFVLDGSEKDA